MIRRPSRSTPLYSSAASDVYKRQVRRSSRSSSSIRKPTERSLSSSSKASTSSINASESAFRSSAKEEDSVMAVGSISKMSASRSRVSSNTCWRSSGPFSRWVSAGTATPELGGLNHPPGGASTENTAATRAYPGSQHPRTDRTGGKHGSHMLPESSVGEAKSGGEDGFDLVEAGHQGLSPGFIEHRIGRKHQGVGQRFGFDQGILLPLAKLGGVGFRPSEHADVVRALEEVGGLGIDAGCPHGQEMGASPQLAEHRHQLHGP